MPRNHELVANDPLNHRLRITFDPTVETFYLQKKSLFVWEMIDYTFDVDVMKSWRASHKLVWVSSRWRH